MDSTKEHFHKVFSQLAVCHIPANATVKLNLRPKIWAPNRDLIFSAQVLGSWPGMSGAGPDREEHIGWPYLGAKVYRPMSVPC